MALVVRVIDIDIPVPPHDPTNDFLDCTICAAAMRLVWNDMAELPSSPRDGELLDWIRMTAAGKLAQLQRSWAPDSHLEPMGPLALIDWIRATARTKFDAMVRVG